MPPPRVAVAVAAAKEFHSHLPPPVSDSSSSTPPPPPPSKCNSQNCPWWPYSSSKEFDANIAIIVIFLLCALISILFLNAAIRCLLRRCSRHNRRHETREDGPEPKLTVSATATQLAVPPILLFSAGMNLAGNQAECIICLSEFVEGDEIRVLNRCGHGFHIHCIHQWLSSQSSCPTCRASC